MDFTSLETNKIYVGGDHVDTDDHSDKHEQCAMRKRTRAYTQLPQYSFALYTKDSNQSTTEST